MDPLISNAILRQGQLTESEPVVKELSAARVSGAATSESILSESTSTESAESGDTVC